MSTQPLTTKTAFLFPGVSAQSPGMFDVFKPYSQFLQSINEVSDVTCEPLQEIIYGQQSERLREVKIAQLSLLAVTTGVARVMQEECALLPDMVLGHSLGQFPAMCIAGHLTLTQASQIIVKRADVLDECAKQVPDGEMCWVLHVPSKIVAREVQLAREDGLDIYISAIDSFDQASVSGSMAQIKAFAPRIEALGGLFFPLRIGGPFHCPLMQPAADELGAALTSLLPADLPKPNAELVCNVTANQLQDLKSSLSTFDEPSTVA